MNRYNLVHPQFTTIQVAEYGRFVYAQDVEKLVLEVLTIAGQPDADKALAEVTARCRRAMRWEDDG